MRVRLTNLLAIVALFLVTACHRGHGSSASHGAARPPAAATIRTTDVVRREGNHLVTSGSLYLQMHAHNPVDWYPWSPRPWRARATRTSRSSSRSATRPATGAT